MAVAAAAAATSSSSGVPAGGAECAGAGEAQRTRAALEHLQQKILKVTEQIRVEQEARDDNVAEYLKLAHNADKQQASRIKQVFEKKNQKSAQTIAHLHKKLEHYHKKLKEIEQVCVCVCVFIFIRFYDLTRTQSWHQHRFYGDLMTYFGRT